MREWAGGCRLSTMLVAGCCRTLRAWLYAFMIFLDVPPPLPKPSPTLLAPSLASRFPLPLPLRSPRTICFIHMQPQKVSTSVYYYFILTVSRFLGSSSLALYCSILLLYSLHTFHAASSFLLHSFFFSSNAMHFFLALIFSIYNIPPIHKPLSPLKLSVRHVRVHI